MPVDAAWQKAPRSPSFTDIITGQPTRYDTRAAVLWDDTNLYVAYRVEEPLVRASFTNRNDPIWQENDVDLFIAGRDAYYEFEINALNTIYEVFLSGKKPTNAAALRPRRSLREERWRRSTVSVLRNIRAANGSDISTGTFPDCKPPCRWTAR